MSNQFTSINTGGFSDNTVKTVWDLALEKVAHERRIFRQFVDKRPERPAMKGSTINLSLYDYLSDATVTAATTALTEEADVDSVKLPATTYVALTFAEYGLPVTRTELLNQETFVNDLDTYAVDVVGTHMADTMDEQIQTELRNTSNLLYSGSATSVGTIAATDVFAPLDVQKVVTKLRAGLSRPWDSNGMYAGVVHPHVVHDIRLSSSANGWRIPSNYGSDQGQVFRGEFGEFEGVRFVQNTKAYHTTDGASSAVAYRSYFLGRQALAEGVLIEPGLRVGPITDKLSRFRTIGWYGIYGYKLYRSESLVIVNSGSSVAAL